MERIVIQSSEDNIIEVEKFISVFCDTYNINNYAGSISISLIQAVKNASRITLHIQSLAKKR